MKISVNVTIFSKTRSTKSTLNRVHIVSRYGTIFLNRYGYFLLEKVGTVLNGYNLDYIMLYCESTVRAALRKFYVINTLCLFSMNTI